MDLRVLKAERLNETGKVYFTGVTMCCSKERKRKDNLNFFFFLALFKSNFCFHSHLPAVTKLSYRHEAKEWGRQSGNIRYHERDAGPPWHDVHWARTAPRPPQASTHKHNNTHIQYLDRICRVHMQTTLPNASRWYDCVLLDAHTQWIDTLAHTHAPPPLHFLPLFLPLQHALHVSCHISFSP